MNEKYELEGNYELEEKVLEALKASSGGFAAAVDSALEKLKALQFEKASTAAGDFYSVFQQSFPEKSAKMNPEASTVPIIKSEYLNPIYKIKNLHAHEAEYTPNEIAEASVLFGLPSRHQTLVIIETTSHPYPAQKERAERLVCSLNNELTIKADVVSISDGKMYDGLVWVGSSPGGVADIKTLAKEAGYNQVVEVTYIGK